MGRKGRYVRVANAVTKGSPKFQWPRCARTPKEESKKEDRSGDIILRNYESRAVARKKHES